MREIFFHEDDYVQIQFLPDSSLEFCIEEMQICDEHAEKHRAAVGAGWTKMYIRKDAPQNLGVFTISASELSAALDRHLARYDHVFTGYSTHRERCVRTLAWGDDGFVLFAEHDEDLIVRELWFGLGQWRAEKADDYVSTLVNLPHASELLIVDWAWSRIVPLADAECLKAYVDERATV